MGSWKHTKILFITTEAVYRCDRRGGGLPSTSVFSHRILWQSHRLTLRRWRELICTVLCTAVVLSNTCVRTVLKFVSLVYCSQKTAGWGERLRNHDFVSCNFNYI